MANDQDIVENLFADLGTTSQQLNTEPDYVGFGKKVSSVLYDGKAPYRIPAFYKEVLKDVGKHLDSKEIKEILDTMTTLYNEKWKAEKEKEKGKATKAKAKLAAGKNVSNQKNFNQFMPEDDYGDEEYGEEEYGGEGVPVGKAKGGRV